jgi:2-dehydropantoate 2-reductase
MNVLQHRYAVLGTGALGGLYGGLLAHAGFDVHFLMRSDCEFTREHGLRVDTPLGNFHLPHPQVYGQVDEMPTVDVVLVCWKTTQNGSLRQALDHLCGPDTIVLVLQNGWDIERDAADIVGENRVLGGCCFLCSNKIGPGHIHHLDYGRIVFGEYSSAFAGEITPRMRQIAAEFQQARIDMQAAADLRAVRWRKLMWNIPYNGLSVVLDADTQQLMGNPQTARLAEELMMEVRESARACGIEIEADHMTKMLADTRKMVPYASSMLLDYRSHRPMEVEAIFGNPLRAAIAAGYRPSKIEMLYRQLAYLNDQTPIVDPSSGKKGAESRSE